MFALYIIRGNTVVRYVMHLTPMYLLLSLRVILGIKLLFPFFPISDFLEDFCSLLLYFTKFQ